METPLKNLRSNICSEGNEVVNFSVPETPSLKRLGYGTGIGVYHLERSPRTGGDRSPWALKKVLREHRHREKDYGQLIMDEASLLRQLDHPNVVGFRGLTQTADGQPVLAMEECTRSLGDAIEERRETATTPSPFPFAIIRKVGVDIANGLDYLHTKALIIHGDVKSYNVLINGDFKIAKLCDFGMSLPLDDRGTAVGEYVGTACWSAPEALLNENVTSKTDVFSYGLTLWEMLTLDPPHIGTLMDDDEGEEDVEEEVEPEYGTRPALPDTLTLGAEGYGVIVELFVWCTEQSPDDRPTAVEALIQLKGDSNEKKAE